jgi:hypothetical protein
MLAGSNPPFEAILIYFHKGFHFWQIFRNFLQNEVAMALVALLDFHILFTYWRHV